MTEYIERDSAVAKITELSNQSGKYTDYECGADDACFIVDHIPAADVVEVVRCKDCKYSAVDFEDKMYCKLVTYYNHVPDDWFCADGERKDGDGDGV